MIFIYLKKTNNFLFQKNYDVNHLCSASGTNHTHLMLVKKLSLVCKKNINHQKRINHQICFFALFTKLSGRRKR